MSRSRDRELKLPPTTLSDPDTGVPRDEAKDLLVHFVTWLEANGIVKAGELPVIPDEDPKWEGEKPYEAVVAGVVDRYLELQWGEDREDEWGHAFDT